MIDHAPHHRMEYMTRENNAAEAIEETKVRIIKKYPNRRLYDTEVSSYITLDDVRKLVVSCELFQVIDSKTKVDITRSVLMQIINEQEDSGEKPMFTNDFLQQVIRSYGNSMQDILSGYFDKSISMLMDQQKRIQNKVSSFIDSSNPLAEESNSANPVEYLQNMAQKNMDMWHKSWSNLKASKTEKR